MRKAYKILFGKPAGRRQLEWEDNTGMNLREIRRGGENINWIEMAQR
jgi:hypothetical protein